ncbi:hypothetical protein CDD83_7086 [Cordyceps sp. RAO-2017]|nr:hypothetical protein CDD83_7086 [Cordyceps sp. RAO-2017]
MIFRAFLFAVAGTLRAADALQAVGESGDQPVMSPDNNLNSMEAECHDIAPVSTIIHHPLPGQELTADTTFDVDVSVRNLLLTDGVSADAAWSEQRVDGETGQIIGHVQLVIERVPRDDESPFSGELSVVYFMQLTRCHMAAVAGVGLVAHTNRLSVRINGGLDKPGRYRVCTVAAAENQQPVTLPPVRRGSPDDCTWFSVGNATAAAEDASVAAGLDQDALVAAAEPALREERPLRPVFRLPAVRSLADWRALPLLLGVPSAS